VSATHRGSRLPRRALPVLAVVLFLAAGVGVLAASGGGDDDPRPERGDTTANSPPSEPDPPPEEAPAEPTTPAPESPGGGPAPAPAEGLGPDETLRAFYERAAADDFEGAWALAGPGVREQLGGYGAFVSTLSSLESIEFPSLGNAGTDTAATVEFTSAATHPDRVDRCTGSATLARAGAGWLIARLQASCTPEPRPTSGGAAPGDSEDDG